MPARRAVVLPALLALALVGCGGGDASDDVPATERAAASAHALEAPFVFEVSGPDVTIRSDDGKPLSGADEAVEVVCANLSSTGFTDRLRRTATWKAGATSVKVSMTESASGLELCALNLPLRKGKQAIAFFDEDAKARYVADQE
jgi:hypothetical protein